MLFWPKESCLFKAKTTQKYRANLAKKGDWSNPIVWNRIGQQSSNLEARLLVYCTYVCLRFFWSFPILTHPKYRYVLCIVGKTREPQNPVPTFFRAKSGKILKIQKNTPKFRFLESGKSIVETKTKGPYLILVRKSGKILKIRKKYCGYPE